MKLVDDELVEREAAPRGGRDLDDPRRAGHALGLEPGARVGQFAPTVEHVRVVVTRHGAHLALEHATGGRRQLVGLAADPDTHPARCRRPDAELDGSIRAWNRAEPPHAPVDGSGSPPRRPNAARTAAAPVAAATTETAAKKYHAASSP